MVSVTQRIKQIKQPRGGYLPVKAFTVTTLDDGQVLNPEESVVASLVGTAVDYLSRFMDGTAVEEAFEISFDCRWLYHGRGLHDYHNDW